MSNTDPTPPLDPLRFLRSIQADAWIDDLGLDHKPADLDDVVDEVRILEKLRHLSESDDDGWIARTSDHEAWIGHVLDRLQEGAVEYDNRSLGRPLRELLHELAEETGDLGAWASLATQALGGRDDLCSWELDLIEHALRAVAGCGARAWAPIAQALTLLAMIDRGVQHERAPCSSSARCAGRHGA